VNKTKILNPKAPSHTAKARNKIDTKNSFDPRIGTEENKKYKANDINSKEIKVVRIWAQVVANKIVPLRKINKRIW